MKTCTKCKSRRRLSSFPPKQDSRDNRGSWCKFCMRKAREISYKKNRTPNINASKKARQRNKIFVEEYLRKHPCVDCDIKDIRVLQFDHVNGKKRKNIKNMVHEAYSLSSIIKEIGKCEVRCANCHQIATITRKNLA